MARRLAKLWEYFRVDCDLIFLLDHPQCTSTAKKCNESFLLLLCFLNPESVPHYTLALPWPIHRTALCDKRNACRALIYLY